MAMLDPWDDGPLTTDAPEWLRSQPPALSAREYRASVRRETADGLAGYGNPYRHDPVYVLKDEQEYRGFQLLEATMRLMHGADPRWSFNKAIAEDHLALIERELQRRRNLIADSGRSPDLRLNERTRIDFAAVKDRIPVEAFADRICTPSSRDRRTSTRLTVRCMLTGHEDDHTPSFTVYIDQQSWWCYGCGRGGDVIDLARNWFAVSSSGNASVAAKHLCQFMGIDPPITPNPDPAPNGTVYGGVAANGSVIDIGTHLLMRRRTGRR